MTIAAAQRASLLPVLALLLSLLQGSAAWGQGLGEEIILSRLGDPVEVEIEVRDWQNLELSRVQVVNATQQQYEAFGLVYQPLLDTLSFNVVGPNLAGEVKILVSSREPVDEPFLDLLLALRWPDGSALREYVLLFDPPLPDWEQSTIESPQPAAPVAVTEPVAPPAEAEVAVPVAVVEPTPLPTAPEPVEPPPPAVTSSESAQEPPAVVPEPPVPAVSQTVTVPESVTEAPLPARPREEAGRRNYRVQNGDTLWTIASQFQPAGIADNMYQFVLSLHDINPAAFIDGNISLLKADAQLQIPSARDLAAINPASAQRVFDQRWLDATRAAQQAETAAAPQLVVSPVAEEPVPAPAEVAQPEPELPPGTELAEVEPEPTLLAPSTAVVLAPAAAGEVAEDVAPPVVARLEVGEPAAGEPDAAETIAEETPAQAPVAAVVPAIQIVPQQVAVTDTATAMNTALDDEPAEASAALQQIMDRATAIRDLLQIRQQRLAAVEQQILALRNQLQQAESRAGELVQDLPQSVDVTRQAVILGLVAAVLLIALGATVLTALRWNRELQARAAKPVARARRR